MVEPASRTAYLTVRNADDADCLMRKVRVAAVHVQDWIAAQSGDPLDILRRMKFKQIGIHPITHHCLNLSEQINQTWTFAVAIAAARQLLLLHPDAGGFHLAPGAHASRELDVMSEVKGLVGAETFAAVKPHNNDKLKKDLKKLAVRPEKYRYVFFMSPAYPGNNHLPKFDRNGVQVWSVDP